MQDIGRGGRVFEKFHYRALKKDPAVPVVPEAMPGGRIEVHAWPVEETVIAEQENTHGRASQLSMVNVIGNVFEAKRNRAGSGNGIWLKSELCEIDDAVARYNDGYRNTKFFERPGKRSHNVAQSADFSERNALRCGHYNLK